jgi:hypothetical protein
VDRLYLYDNSIEGSEARLVIRAKEGVVAKRYGDVPAWMAPIVAPAG